LFQIVPAHGRLIVSSDDDLAIRLAAEAACPVVTTGQKRGAALPITDVRLSPLGSAFRVGAARFDVPAFGVMNVRNAAMAAAAAAHFGVSLEQSALALREFKGIDNRQAGRDLGGCTLVVDKATHPTSIEELQLALRQRYPGRRLVSVLQPRATGGRHWVYQRELPKALAGFDRVILTSPYEHKPPSWTAWQAEPFSIEALAEALGALSVDVTRVRTLDDAAEALGAILREGDVVLLSLREQFVEHVAAFETALGRHGRMSHRRSRALGPRPALKPSASARSSST
jgi:UDP-N-acetylmuramate: L-alanyl-gamma-D-glutamyl-meso-diaminopimelate ligase